MSYNGIQVNHIVATDLKGCIVKDGKMPWHISDDLKRFKELTTGGVVIMGRKTFESLGCKPLPNRFNIVVTRDVNKLDIKTGSTDKFSICSSIDAAMNHATADSELSGIGCVWIIGGSEIYAQTMQYVDVIERTIVNTEIGGGDAFYPTMPNGFESHLLSENFKDEKSGLLFHYRKLIKE